MVTKTITERIPDGIKRQKPLIIGFPILAAIVLWASLSNDEIRKSVDINIVEQGIVDNLTGKTANDEKAFRPDYEYIVKSGDTLSTIFEHLGFGLSDLRAVLEADSNYLSLDTIKPGDTFRLLRGEDGHSLSKLELVFNLAEKVEFIRLPDGSYEYHDIKTPGEWKPLALSGVINGSFSQSVNQAGLNSVEIDQIVRLLKDKINFKKDIRAGDTFEIVESKQYVDGKFTGNREVQAIKIAAHGQDISAYLFKDGQYYDKNGKSLQKAFRRYPTARHWRITSGFNPHRKHPVTGRLAPHNGTDLGTPVGTPVLATGDGVVTMVVNHPIAGRYVVIKHDNTYTSRYLHLSKALVHRGQRVSRGQKIALSGSTGRVTGPHLHYELIVRGRPVNAMTAKIPMATSVPPKDMKAFIVRRNALEKMIHQQKLHLADTRQTRDTHQS